MSQSSPSNDASTSGAESVYRLTERGEKYLKDLAQIEDWFEYHAPTPHQVRVLEQLRQQIKAFAKWYVGNVADSRERAIGLTQLRLAVMALNQGVIFDRQQP